MKQTKRTKSAMLMLIALLLVAFTLLCFAACDNSNNSQNNGNNSNGNITPGGENNNNSEAYNEIADLVSNATCYATENNVNLHYYARIINNTHVDEAVEPVGCFCELSLSWQTNDSSDYVALLYFKNDEAAACATLPPKYVGFEYVERNKNIITVSESDSFKNTLNAIKSFTPSKDSKYKKEETFIIDNLNSSIRSQIQLNKYLGLIAYCDINDEFNSFGAATSNISYNMDVYPEVGNCIEHYYCLSPEPAEAYMPEIKNDEFTQDSYVKQDDNGTVYAYLKEKPGLKFTLIDGKDEYRIYKFNYDTADDFNLVIPSEYNGKPVTAIDNGNDNNTTDASFDGGIFDYYTNLVSVVIPDSITYIDYLAFRGCSGLKSVTIPDSVTEIDRCAFWGCDELTSVTIGVGLETIGSQAFDYCPKFKNVYIKDIAKWCELSFSNQTDSSYNLYLNDELITDLIIPDTLTEISSGAFYNCGSLTSIAIPDSVQRIGHNAFTNCDSLTNIVISDSVQSIEQSAFYNCDSLTSIVIPDCVQRIENSAFADCDSLNDVTIGSNVTYIGSSAFSNCKNLASITISENNTKHHSVGNCIIETETKTLVIGCKNSIIPWDGSVEVIGTFAFANCSGLSEILIPYCITSIDRNAFSGCSDLVDVIFADSIVYIGDYAFDDCKNLTTVYLPSSLKYIGKEAFDENLKSIYFADSELQWSYIFNQCEETKNVPVIFNSDRNPKETLLYAESLYWQTKNNLITSGNVTIFIPDNYSDCRYYTFYQNNDFYYYNISVYLENEEDPHILFSRYCFFEDNWLYFINIMSENSECVKIDLTNHSKEDVLAMLMPSSMAEDLLDSVKNAEDIKIKAIESEDDNGNQYWDILVDANIEVMDDTVKIYYLIGNFNKIDSDPAIPDEFLNYKDIATEIPYEQLFPEEKQ